MFACQSARKDSGGAETSASRKSKCKNQTLYWATLVPRKQVLVTKMWLVSMVSGRLIETQCSSLSNIYTYITLRSKAIITVHLDPRRHVTEQFNPLKTTFRASFQLLHTVS